MKHSRLAIAAGAAALLGGCALYHPLPLAQGPDLAGQLSSLRTQVPVTRPDETPRRIDVDKPVGIDDIGLLAVLNDPELRSEQGQTDVARANLLQSSLLPNPSASVSFSPLLGGTDVAPAWAASLSQDVKSILTYHTRKKSARLQMQQVNADLLWQQWQVAQKARLLALDLYYGQQSLDLSRRELALLDREVKQVQAATEAGNLDLTALAPLLTAKATAEQLVASLGLTQLQNWQALDALLGLDPQVRFGISAPSLPPLPSNLTALLTDLPGRRPDLVALQLGYRSADEDVRSAVIGQFPALALGGEWGQDTSNVRSAGPAATFDLPIFDRNQGQVAQSRATRLLLHEQYQSRLDDAFGTVKGLDTQIRRLTEDIRNASSAAAAAGKIAQSAQRAYAQGNMDQRSLADFETTALDRRIEALALERALGETQITLTVELGLGLPQTRIATASNPRKS
ncbi:MAG TPA: TolC family protein [Steroidobacteraceae bacterium]|jgi:outer membrane protein TolC|nr:TolC family protein [Steroidobacteraceae bacterium]